MPFYRWELGFKQSSFHHVVRVLRIEALNAFGSPSASTTCDCPLWLSPPGKPLTQEFPSELLLSKKGILDCAYVAHMGRADYQRWIGIQQLDNPQADGHFAATHFPLGVGRPV